MFNLIPEVEKREILKEYRLRHGVVLLTFLFILTTLAFIFLIPSYLVSSSREKEIAGRVEAVRRSTIREGAPKINLELTQTNQKIQAMKPKVDGMAISDLLDKALAYKENSIRVSSIEYKKNEKEGNTLSLFGIARNRESLSQFVKSLESDGLFNKVSIPVSSFAKDRNADFSITVNGKF